jgi:hypothetical protein
MCFFVIPKFSALPIFAKVVIQTIAFDFAKIPLVTQLFLYSLPIVEVYHIWGLIFT